MEKPKLKVSINLDAVKKYHFWILLGVVLIAGLVTWNMASGALRQSFEENKGKIDRATNQLNSLQSELPPNQKFIEKLDGEQSKIDTQSLDAWKLFYDVQRDRLKWPKGSEAIGELGPHEDIPERMRAGYMNNVLLPAWQAIFEKANLRRPKDGQAAVQPGMINDQNRKVEYEGIVYWDPAKRRQLQDRYVTKTIPTTVQVRCTQEDLWIFDSLVDIVLKMNEGKDDPVAAVIKSIDLFEVGPPAVSTVFEQPGLELDIEGLVPGFHREERSDETANPDVKLLTNRYLNEQNKPVPPADVGTNPPFAEFRQVFVVMRFVMDQRRIPDLLAACANSPLPIEARQVLLSFIDVDSKDSDRADVQRAITAGNVERGPYDALVEVRGIVYLYNQPVNDKLGTGSAPQPARRQLGVPSPPQDELLQ